MPDSSEESDMAFFLWTIYFSGIFNISYKFQTDLKNSEREQVRLHGTGFMGIFAES